MDLRDILLILHILVAMVTVGWLAMQAMLIPRAIRDGNVGAVRFSAGAAEKLGGLSILVFVLGLWLVGVTGWEMKDAWVGAAMGLFLLAAANGALLMGRTEKRALAKLEAGQDAKDEAGKFAMLGGINMLLLIVILYLMVVKPGSA